MDTVDVVVRQGTLRGIVEKNDYGGRYVAFRGVPYAKPPVGELRFKVSSNLDSNHVSHSFSLCIAPLLDFVVYPRYLFLNRDMANKK